MGVAEEDGADAPTDETAVRSLALGIKAPLGESFPCVVPDHDEHEARLCRTAAGYWQYDCPGKRTPCGLAEIRAFIAYGKTREIKRTEVTRWRARLDYEAGLITPKEVPIDLRDGVGETVRHVANGWALLVGLRDPARWEEEKFTFAREFVMAWCGVSDQQARDSVRALEREGVIRRTGRKIRTGTFPAIEWVPASTKDLSPEGFIDRAKTAFPGSREIAAEMT